MAPITGRRPRPPANARTTPEAAGGDHRSATITSPRDTRGRRPRPPSRPKAICDQPRNLGVVGGRDTCSQFQTTTATITAGTSQGTQPTNAAATNTTSPASPRRVQRRRRVGAAPSAPDLHAHEQYGRDHARHQRERRAEGEAGGNAASQKHGGSEGGREPWGRATPGAVRAGGCGGRYDCWMAANGRATTSGNQKGPSAVSAATATPAATITASAARTWIATFGARRPPPARRSAVSSRNGRRAKKTAMPTMTSATAVETGRYKQAQYQRAQW